jgi:hypothetical protein
MSIQSKGETIGIGDIIAPPSSTPWQGAKVSSPSRLPGPGGAVVGPSVFGGEIWSV